jgi:hypothetical protein
LVVPLFCFIFDQTKKHITMAKIYASPLEVKIPEFNWENVEQYRKDCDTYKENLKTFLRKRNSGKTVGEVLRFQVADGYAEYMVASLKPVELVHLPLWDEYQFEYADLMTAEKIQEQIARQNALKELFSRK